MARKSLNESAKEILEKSIRDAHKESMKPGLKDPNTAEHEEIIDGDEAKPDYAKSIKKDTSAPVRNARSVSEEFEEDEDEMDDEDEKEMDDEEDEKEMDDEELEESNKDIVKAMMKDKKDRFKKDAKKPAKTAKEKEKMPEETIRPSFAELVENGFSFSEFLDKKIKIENIAEDIETMFKGSDFSDEFKEKASTIFEAAVIRKVKQVQNEIAEAADFIVGEEIVNIQEELSENVDVFLKSVMSEWLEENKVEIEVGLRTQIAEDFMEAIRGVMIEHYIELPDEKRDIYEELQAEKEELEEALNEEIDQKTQNYKYIKELESQIVFNNLVRENNLTVSEEEELRSLAEDIEINNIKKYSEKLNTLYENFILVETKNTKDNIKNRLISENSENINNGIEEVVNVDVNKLTKNASRFLR